MGDKKYNPLSLTHIEMIRGEYEYTFPDSPNVTAVKDTEKNAWWALFYSSAEVNFYLTELGLLGANLPNSPESYFEEGVRLSVLEHDRLGSLNKIPYYSSVYDPNETVIALQDGELDALLEQEAYQLTGTTLEKLEKVYIQQYIHFFINLPNDQFVAVRRSGVPMRNNKLLPWSNFTNNEASYYIPRRFMVNSPLETDLLYNIKKAAYQAEGFTTGTNDPQTLNTESMVR
ncbi:MAG: SusD/RagB family nutrient-binding outer membrane lipoprotein [Tannerellaceae bacterium]|nr:SusD/RagB family nutrient-binding outer membrane lipoprotein [Tannerellaceae bacterium]